MYPMTMTNQGHQAVQAIVNGNMALGGPTPINAIPREFADLASSTNELHTVLDEVEKRLEGIRTPQPPNTGAIENAKPQPPVSGIALSLREQRERVGYAVMRLRALLSQIEL